ncbi:MAG: Phosphoribosylformylglycinamidine synthase subunit PurL [Elusimicrobia bacterium]|nr:Phosphoribosylformylglycinamidine synthase subunit PurL [Elusimicrobiota bacterium]
MNSSMTSSSEKTRAAQIINLSNAEDSELERISREGLLSLTLQEMKTIQAHFSSLRREPTDIELETIAQTWSEHCYHKTFRARCHYREEVLDGETPLGDKLYENLLKETIMRATRELNNPWCLSVFEDNAGVIGFDEEDALCFKVETHNHPSALEPYGGAGTGLGGVIRDILGCGLGGTPVMNTDVFCFGPLDTAQNTLREGMLHPKRIAKGVVSGVRDYGNRMGIPTSNGAVYFDSGYIGNPLVFCGTVGLIPNDAIKKTVQPGDLVVTVGGRTGRDGIHGATFSSAPLEKGITSSVVQIGHAIQEKKTMDVLLQARNKRLYRSITDCGAGGFSSAIGELGKNTGVKVQLEKAPLKYPGLAPWEIWLSESQERMVLAVPPEHWQSLSTLFRQEDVEAVVIGEFTSDKKLTICYEDETVGELQMDFLHDGCPKLELEAVWNSNKHRENYREGGLSVQPSLNREDLPATLKSLLAHPVIASKESVIRQYDHEVQGGSVLKPLMGVDHDAPMDAAVFRPKLSLWKGVVVSNGLNPEIGKWDPYLMAKMAVDEAYRNMIAVGGHLTNTAILDNFCWGDAKNSFDLGGLVRAAEGAKEAALAYQLPFISGKDSFHNTWRSADGQLHSIPPTLLISAIGVLEDVRGCVSSGLKGANNLIYLLGETRGELKGSLVAQICNQQEGKLPTINFAEARILYKKIQNAMKHKLILSCHDLSEGGLAVAAAEMAFGGNVGMEIRFPPKGWNASTVLFSETPSRFLVEVAVENKLAFEQTMGALFVDLIGKTTKKASLSIIENEKTLLDEPIKKLKEIWKNSLKGL